MRKTVNKKILIISLIISIMTSHFTSVSIMNATANDPSIEFEEGFTLLNDEYQNNDLELEQDESEQADTEALEQEILTDAFDDYGYEMIPTNSDFARWQNDEDIEIGIPDEYLEDTQDGNLLPESRINLPARWDPREQDNNILTPGKQQMGGSCWIFAGTAILESFIKMQTGEEVILSENHARFAISGDFNNRTGIAGQRNNVGGGVFPNSIGGATPWLAAYWMRSTYGGPVLQQDDPYHGLTDAPRWNTQAPRQGRVTGVQRIPNLPSGQNPGNVPAKRHLIQEAIIEFGSVSTSYLLSGASVNRTPAFAEDQIWSYYLSTDLVSGHLAQIVGWDDNYYAGNFTNRPPGNGAWLVKDSSSTAAESEDMLIWISFYQAIGGATFVTGWDEIAAGGIFEYTPYGVNDYWADISRPYYSANIFDSHDTDAYLQEVTVFIRPHVRSSDRIYHRIYVATGEIGSDRQSLLEEAVAQPHVGELSANEFRFPGFYTIRLDNPIPVGNRSFAVVLNTTNTTNTTGGNVRVWFERANNANSVTNPGESFYSRDGGTTWTDMYESLAPYGGNFPIYAIVSGSQGGSNLLPTVSIPTAPTMESANDTSITLNTQPELEYRMRRLGEASWSNWQTSGVFADLTPATTYEFQKRRIGEPESPEGIVARFSTSPWKPFEVPVDGIFVDNNVRWRVLYENDQGDRLIMTENVQGWGNIPGIPAMRRRYNMLPPGGPGNVWTPLRESSLQNTLNNWWGANVSDALRNVATPVENLDANYGNSTSTPGEGIVATDGSNTLFIFSREEVERYLPAVADRTGYDTTGVVREHWFLRSANLGSNGSDFPVHGSRNVHSATNQNVGFRPAMWIRNPFRTPVGDTFEDNNVTWRVLHENAQGYRLIMTETVQGWEAGMEANDRRYNLSNVWTPLRESNLQNTLNNWWGANVSDALSNVATPVENLDVNSGNSTSIPGEGKVAANGSNTLFIFSREEVERYLPTVADRTGYDANGVVREHWFLRSANLGSNGSDFPVHGSRNLHTANNANIGFRPVMWIRPIEPIQSENPFEVSVGDTFADNNVTWRVLHENAQGDRLIMTETVQGWERGMIANDRRYNTTNVWTPLRESNLQNTLNNWWGTNVSNALRNVATPVENMDANYGNSTSAPGEGAVAENGSNTLFILSLTEVERYLPTATSRIGSDRNEQERLWYLRSQRSIAGTDFPVNAIRADGLASSQRTDMTAIGFRPVMWIRNPFRTPVGDTFEDNNVTWRVLHENAQGYRLIMTEDVQGWERGMIANDRRYNITNVWTPLRESNLQNTLNNWWGANVSNALRNVATPVENMDENYGNSTSTPSEGVVAANGSNTLFVLSLTEVERYLPTVTSRIGSDLNEQGRIWYLRSQRSIVGSDFPINAIRADGLASSQRADITAIGFRPVMWIRPVEPAQPVNPFEVSVGDTFADNNVTWRVLHENAEGDRLIMTENVQGWERGMIANDRRFNKTNVWTPLRESNLQNTLNNWWGTNVSNALRNVATPVENLDENYGNSTSVPGESVVAANGSNTLFILSREEVERYLPTITDRIGFDLNEQERTWYLRSQRFIVGSDFPINAIRADGLVASFSATTTGIGFRPAMWIRNP